MKILLINDQFERGGAGRVACIQCNGLQKRGYDIVLISDSKHWRETYLVDKTIQRRDITVKTTTPGLIAKLIKWLKCSIKIRSIIKQETPDVIIAIQSMMFLCAYIGKIGLNIPIIAADHTSFDRKIDPIIDFVRYRLYAWADGLSILTKKDARLLGTKFPRKKVIYNPLTYPLLTTSTCRTQRVLCAGRLEDWNIKGFDRMIKMWAFLAPNNTDWKLEIAGSGTESSVSYLQDLIDNYGVSESVTLLGHVNNMKKLYEESAIFALPSRIEGFPMVLMEAMSQGCACVAFSIGGASDEMLYKNSGVIVPDGDLSKFQEELNNLMNNKELRDKCSMNALSTISKFSEDVFLDAWENMINSVVN